MVGIIVPAALLLLVYGTLALIAWRRPLLGRLAWREATRRPAHTTLLVAGMMFGTAAILGMQGVGDTFQRVTTDIITTGWGRTDITVSRGGEPFPADVASSLAADPRLAAGAAGVQGGLVLIGSVGDLDRQLSASPVQISSFDTSRAFGTFGLVGGGTSDGTTLGSDETILSSLLAGSLEAQRGDRLQVDLIVGGRSEQLTFRVAGIARAGAVNGLGQQPVLFVPLAVIQSAANDGSINIVRISAKGDGQQEIDNAHALAPSIRTLLGAMPGGAGLEVREVKAQDLTTNEQQGGPTRIIFVALSFFVVLAGTALVVNLSLALAEERRPRLAVLRALGLSRTGMVMVAILEGSFYSLAAALVGVLPGLAYTYLVDSRPVPGGFGSQTNSGTGAELFNIAPASVSVAICLGALITLVTIAIVSIRTSRMAISSAIRDLPEPARASRRSWFGLAWPLLLAVAGVVAWLPGGAAYRAAGGAALIVAASKLAGGRVSERVRATLTGTALVLWELASLLTAPAQSYAQDNGFGLGFVAVVISVFGAAIVISANLRLLEVGINFVSGGLLATLRPPLAYLTRRPVRSGLATGAFALVLASLAFYAVLIPSLNYDPLTVANGYDVRVKALGVPSFTVPDSLQSQVASTESLSTLAYIGPLNTQIAGSPPVGWQTNFAELYALTDQQLGHPPLVLSTRDPRYSSDAAAWLAIRNDPSLVMTTSGSLGQASFASNQGVERFQVIGVIAGVILVDQGQSAGSFVGSVHTFNNLSVSGVGTTVLIRTAHGVDPAAFTRSLRKATFSQAVDVVSGAELVDISNQLSAWFSGFFTLLLKTAVVVGVLSFGILALRAAIERRRAIGVLRALGYRPGQVVGGLLTEALVTATVGIVVGIGVGFGMAWAYLTASGTTQTSIDLSQVLIPAGLIYAAVLLVTVGPAMRASRMPASDALRIMG
jgi:putative ABC transport system permease protein